MSPAPPAPQPTEQASAPIKVLSPMMRQYVEVKQAHEDAILFFRVGDFYEMFLEDALTASRELDIVLTSRDKDSEQPIPFCGVPHHAATNYIQRLIDKGYKVAICDQTEDPSAAKGIVRREVVRVVTPGTVLEEDGLEPRAASYLVALSYADGRFGCAALDVSTGEFNVTDCADDVALLAELSRIRPREIVASDAPEVQGVLAQSAATDLHAATTTLPARQFAQKRSASVLQQAFHLATLDGLGLSDAAASVGAAGVVMEYARANAKRGLDHVRAPRLHRSSDFLLMDEATRRNLDLVASQAGKKGTLLSVLDRTQTSMGARCLASWLSAPLKDVTLVNARLGAVSVLKDDRLARADVRELLASCSDLERIVGRAATGLASPRDLGALARTLSKIPALVAAIPHAPLADLRDRLDPCAPVCDELSRALVEDPPARMSDGSFIREGFDAELDGYASALRDGKGWIAALENAERTATGIQSLKVRYNKVFGYFIEVTKANLAKVPSTYTRKQTTSNSERFITPALKEMEDKVLNAEERATRREAELFETLRSTVAHASARLQRLARAIAELDVLSTFADNADRYNYCAPVVSSEDRLFIKEGRHPVIERMDLGERFIPNDVLLDEQVRVLLITGPNMAGKSTVIRQVALITLMAQTGSFVPATEAHIGVVDRIFTRVGASDMLARGQSTFMVEMSETANILNHATARSLVVVDEIGRGTSTYDGVSIAWAVAEDLHDRVQAKTLFATHYHELTDLPESKPRMRNFSIAVKEWSKQIIFLRSLVEGRTSRSYGIQVARLAGVPASVLDRAREVLANLEATEHDALGQARLAESPSSPGASNRNTGQFTLFASTADQVAAELRDLDLDALTPREALELLYRLREKL